MTGSDTDRFSNGIITLKILIKSHKISCCRLLLQEIDEDAANRKREQNEKVLSALHDAGILVTIRNGAGGDEYQMNPGTTGDVTPNGTPLSLTGGTRNHDQKEVAIYRVPYVVSLCTMLATIVAVEVCGMIFEDLCKFS